MKSWSLIFSGIFVAFSLYSWAEQSVPVEQILQITQDLEAGTSLTAEVEYGAQCYEPTAQKAVVQETTGIIELYHKAGRSSGMCALSFKNQVIDFELGHLPDGSYLVVDGASSNQLAQFSIKKGKVLAY